MEIAIGLYALLVPALLDLYPELNRTLLASLGFWPAALVRFALVLAVLLLPTFLMGATLPVLVASLVRGRHEIANRVGLLYGVNTLGAVTGVLGATFVGFAWLGVRGTNTTAAVPRHRGGGAGGVRVGEGLRHRAGGRGRRNA